MSIVKLNPLPIRFHCYKVLPLVYDEALSYYEQLCKIVKTLNDAVISINDLNDAVTDISSEYSNLNGRVTLLENTIGDIEKNVNDTLQTINETIANYDVRFDELEDELTKKIDNNVKALKDYIDETLANVENQIRVIVEEELKEIYDNIDKLEVELIARIDSEIRKLIASIPDLTTIEVINPVTGVLSKVQNAIDDLFMNTRYNALTVDEFNHLHLSVEECNKLLYHSAPTGWSVIVWLTEAKELLDKSLKHRMANAITGAWQDFKKSIEENTDMFRVCGCLTVDEYAAHNYTVDDFNNFGITCEQLAWESNRIFV